jgi:hypothetical protein
MTSTRRRYALLLLLFVVFVLGRCFRGASLLFWDAVSEVHHFYTPPVRAFESVH